MKSADLGGRQAEATSQLLDSLVVTGASHVTLPTLRKGLRRCSFSKTALRTKSFTEFTEPATVAVVFIIIITTFEQRGKNKAVIASPSIHGGRGPWLWLTPGPEVHNERSLCQETKEIRWKEQSFPSRSREAPAKYEKGIKSY